MMAMKRFTVMAGLSPTAQALGADLAQYKEESEKVRWHFIIQFIRQ